VGRVARRFSAAAGDLALVDNVTDGVNAVLRALALRPGDERLPLDSRIRGNDKSVASASQLNLNDSTLLGDRFRGTAQMCKLREAPWADRKTDGEKGRAK
jgi:hypothetical protein